MRVMTTKWITVICLMLAVGDVGTITLADHADREPSDPIQCAVLDYGQQKPGACFSTKFLELLTEETHILVRSTLKPVAADSRGLFEHPFVVWEGRGTFDLSGDQRNNLRNYLRQGGFLLVSANCSDPAWNLSFRQELAMIFPDPSLKPIELDHPLFKTVFEIRALRPQRIAARPQLEGLELEGRLVLVYSSDGLNDTREAPSECCCCGGSEILNARELNANILAYALSH